MNTSAICEIGRDTLSTSIIEFFQCDIGESPGVACFRGVIGYCSNISARVHARSANHKRKNILAAIAVVHISTSSGVRTLSLAQPETIEAAFNTLQCADIRYLAEFNKAGTASLIKPICSEFESIKRSELKMQSASCIAISTLGC